MFTTSLATDQDALERVGGKGRSLSKMAREGFNVPTGFIVTTDAYRSFIADNSLQNQIVSDAKPQLKEGYPAFDHCSTVIGDKIQKATIDATIVTAIKTAYREIQAQQGKGAPVAVRSSANAEDLPGLSFAGQQETFLNVRGEDAVVAAVKDCWASLWTAQAISYRHQNGIDQDSVAMAVVVQLMVPSEVSGILFTANPASGERAEIIINGSFGLGEAVVSGQVTPDTYIINRKDLSIQQELLGPKEHQIVADGDNGVRMEHVAEADRSKSSISPEQLNELCETALQIEALYEGLPQDIEWAFCGGILHLLQSRPITNLGAQPIDVVWEPTAPARFVSRRQIVENMPEPISPLFEELYLTKGLESPRPKSLMVGGGPMFVTVNGYAYQRFDFPQVIKEADERKQQGETLSITEEEIEAAEYSAFAEVIKKSKEAAKDAAIADLKPFKEQLSAADRASFDTWYETQDKDAIDGLIVLPESNNPTYIAFNNTTVNDKQLKSWYDETLPRLEGVADKWRTLDVQAADDATLLSAVVEMGIEEGRYWSADSSHTFGVAKSTDDQLQCFLRETLPEHNFISGQFLTGIESKAMQANADLFAIAKLVRASEQLSYLVLSIPSQFLLSALRNKSAAVDVVAAIDSYLAAYGHQGYSMDFIEPTQVEDPSALFATLKGMVRDENYDPKNQAQKTAAIREKKLAEISELLSGLSYWQFRFRLWLALKYNFIREEVAFRFGYTWSILRPMVNELGQRLAANGTLRVADHAYFLVSEELEQALNARKAGQSLPELGKLAEERCTLREARKLHHPPGTLPAEASAMQSISFKETQIKNDDDSNVMRGFPVSSGTITAKASVILGPAEFDKMIAGSILVSPLTTPAWTQLFANAVGLVTDVGSILAHGSIVAREYGIPAVLGVGDGTKRIKHGQTITVEGDSGIVTIHDDEE
ncbi:MAG: PEP/pyruvate-binding domain-containing protein [Pseudomonadota bacterium]|nr:PEP/pyruvate-binding domain-containing protein [Pseudomonadota bacterium]